MDNMKRSYFKDDIRRTFIVYALFPVLFITFSCVLAVFVFLNITTIRQNKDSNQFIAQHLETTISGYVEMLNDIANEYDVTQIRDDIEIKTDVYHRLYKYTNNASERAEFYILDSDKSTIISSTTVLPKFAIRSSDISWGTERKLKEHPKEVAFSLNNVYHNNIKMVQLDICKAIIKNEKITGYVVFSLTDDIFSRNISSVPTQIIVSNRYNSIFLATNYLFYDNIGRTINELHNAQGYIKYNNEKFYISQRSILNEEFHIYAITPVSKMSFSFLYISILLLLVFGMMTVAIFISAKKISVSKTKIIDELVEGFESVIDGNLDTRMNISSGDEFEIIGDSYNIMLDSLKNLIQINNEKARQTILSEIKQLESQFNPHFLFNTLENIRFMSKLDPDAANKMIVALSTLLRYSINSNIKDSTLAEDIEYTENYLCIQKYRFSSRFNYIISMQPETEDCIIPKLIIQPIIENAIKYGFVEKESLTVRIKTTIMGENLVLVIFDDGDGMETEQLNEITKILQNDTNNSNHIGLFNVHRRIQLMYGYNNGLEIKSEKGEGTAVKITLPIHRRGVDENND